MIGDAACAFNPVYGQGMTVVALGAGELGVALKAQFARRPDGSLAGLGKVFQQRLAKLSATPWLLATNEDFRWPTNESSQRLMLNG